MSKKKIVFSVVIIAILIGVTFDQYMKATWDHHIVGDEFQKYITINSNGDWRLIEGKELESLPYIYKERIGILKNGNQYMWSEKLLDKTTETKNPHESFAPQPPYDQVKVTNFTTDDQSIKIRVATGGYLRTGCQPFNRKGNSSIIYQRNNGDRLIVKTNVEVYENLAQYLMCKIVD